MVDKFKHGMIVFDKKEDAMVAKETLNGYQVNKTTKLYVSELIWKEKWVVALSKALRR